MNSWDDCIEFEFILIDGTKRYEFCGSTKDVHDFTKMHGAVKAWSVAQSEKRTS